MEVVEQEYEEGERDGGDGWAEILKGDKFKRWTKEEKEIVAESHRKAREEAMRFFEERRKAESGTRSTQESEDRLAIRGEDES